MSRSRTSSEKAGGRGRIVVLSGPSGVGKTTVSSALLEDPRMKRVITATTRCPRPGEVDGIDYLFMTRPDFARHRENGDFLEWAEVHGEFYATPSAPVEALVSAGKDALLVIDVQGAAQVKSSGVNALFLFLLPPTLDILRERLTGRGTERKDQVDRRLETAARETAEAAWFDHQVVNDSLESTVAELREILAYPE